MAHLYNQVRARLDSSASRPQLAQRQDAYRLPSPQLIKLCQPAWAGPCGPCTLCIYGFVELLVQEFLHARAPRQDAICNSAVITTHERHNTWTARYERSAPAPLEEQNAQPVLLLALNAQEREAYSMWSNACTMEHFEPCWVLSML